MKNIFINPGQLNKLSEFLSPWLAIISFIFLIFGLWLSFFYSPIDYQQGNAVRILYIHAPSAWLSMLIYSFLAINSFFGLVFGHVTAFTLARAAAPIGLTFTAICLVTGSVWGKPMWGTWWVWDARLTSELILFFIYISIIILNYSFDDYRKGARAASILAIIGFINIPIIHFSVEWWNTLHQGPSVMKFGTPSISTEMLIPLIYSAIGFTFYFIGAILLSARNMILIRERNKSWVKKI